MEERDLKPTYNTLRLYLSAPIRSSEYNQKICNYFNNRDFSVFLPQTMTPKRVSDEYFPYHVYTNCIKEMEKSDLCLLLPPYGNDCAFEIGWYRKAEKPVIVYVADRINFLRDWMVKGGCDAFITDSPTTFQVFREDPIIGNKPHYLIASLNELPYKVREVYEILTKKY